MFKVNNGNTRTRSEICSKLTIKIPERRVYEIPHSDKDKQILNLHAKNTNVFWYISTKVLHNFTISCDSVVENNRILKFLEKQYFA